MTVRHIGAGAVSFLLLAVVAIPQTMPPLDWPTIRQRMEDARRRQKEANDLPILTLADAGRSTPAPKARSLLFSTPGTPRLPSTVVPGDVWRHISRLGHVAALPLQDSDVVVRGVVIAARACLTDDQTSLYSEFDIRVERVYKSASGVSAGGTLTVLRWGGALQLPSGLMRLRQADQLMPVVGGNYVLFLKRHSPDDPAFLVSIGYRLEGGRVCALDILPEPMRFDTTPEATLLAALDVERP